MNSINETTHPTTRYALEAVNGQRVVGRMERLACQRHLENLARQDDPAFPWVFDETKANKIFHWFSFCKHVEGPLAGQPIILEPFQLFDLGSIFGWVSKETGYRRFEKALIEEARKNGKSTIMSGVTLYMMCGDGEQSPKVYCAAVDKDQARIVFDSAKNMAIKSPDIRKRLRIRQLEVGHISRGGRMLPLSRETQNKDGLNPSCAVIDEYHAHKTSEIYDLIWTAWGQRSQALMLIITTAGVDAEKSPCFAEYKMCKQIVEGQIPNDRYFVMIRELDPDDDEHDPANWIKSNPLRAATPEGLAKMQEQHDEVFNSKNPSKIRAFRIKILNKWVYDSDAGYIGEYLKKWNELAVSRDEFNKLTEGLSCIVGWDLSKRIDLTADGFVFQLPEPDGRVAVCARGFIPQEAVVRHEQTDRIPYREWEKDGWVFITPGDVTDYTALESHIHDVELEQSWKIHEIAFDPYNATHLANEMAADGYTCVEIRQGVRTLSEPTKLFRDLIAQGKIVHDGSPLLTWSLANAKEVQDNNQNIKLDKKSPMDTQRIDPLAAVINAMVRLPVLKDNPAKDISDEILADDWGM